MAKSYKPTEVYIEASDLGCEYGTINASEKIENFEGCQRVAVFKFDRFARVQTEVTKTFTLEAV